jgi:membrane-bound lytic murein transglycosylase D
MGKSSLIRAGNILLVPVKDLRRSARIASRPSYRAPERLPSKTSLPLLVAADGERAIRYVVKKNDSLVKIAERFNTRLGELREWNNLGHDSRIAPGDTLVIRLIPVHSSGSFSRSEASREGEGGGQAGAVADTDEQPAEVRWIVHVVQKGDTLTSISRRYKARLSDVLAWNKKTKRSTLYPGDKIKIRVQTN